MLPSFGLGWLNSENNERRKPEMTETHSSEKTVAILYTNYRGETAVRRIVPKRIWFGKTDWHPEEQWILDALDVEKGADRGFALKDVKAWFVEK
jgi:predicted DNA-binding transcriptional regulator YafY